MARWLVARHFRKGATKCTAWAVPGTEVKLSHRVLGQLCLCVNQLICSWQLLAWSHRGCRSLFLGLRWQEWRCLLKINLFSGFAIFSVFSGFFLRTTTFSSYDEYFRLKKKF